MNSLYLPDRFFWGLGIAVTLLALGFIWLPFYILGLACLVLLTGLVVTDAFFLYRRSVIVVAERSHALKLSLGDANPVHLKIANRLARRLHFTIYEELPEQLQYRNNRLTIVLPPNQAETMSYTISPTERGQYLFGNTNVFARTDVGVLERRTVYRAAISEAKVYPSLIQMKKYQLMAFSSIARFEGLKKIRKIGHNYEFDKIRDYVRGDDYRSINWKASARRGTVMVNQYTDEKAQQVYLILDKGRAMQLAFEGMSLLDYAINTSLTIANVALQKYDKAGLISFARQAEALIPAGNRPNQLPKMLETLYAQQPSQTEADYLMLYQLVGKHIQVRSLLILFANFESLYALERVLPALRRLNHRHLLVVVFFVNTEIADFAKGDPKNLEDSYLRTIADRYLFDRQQMQQILEQYGIQTIQTRPQDLSIQTLNKYLELKSRGLI